MKKILIIISMLATGYLLFSYFVYQNQNKIYLDCLNKPKDGYSQEMIRISQNDCNTFKQNFMDIILRKQTIRGTRLIYI